MKIIKGLISIIIVSLYLSGCSTDDQFEKLSTSITVPMLNQEIAPIVTKSGIDAVLQYTKPIVYDAILFSNRYDDNKMYVYDLLKNRYSPVKDSLYMDIQGKENPFYYLQASTQGPVIAMKDQSGNVTTVVDENISGFKIHQDNIYYYYGNNIYRVDLNGKNKVRIATMDEEVHQIQLLGDNLFASDFSTLIQVNLKDFTQKMITNTNFSSFVATNETVYLLNNQIHAIDIDSGNESVIIDETAFSIAVTPLALYYVYQEGIARYDFATRTTSKLFVSEFITQISIVNEYIYFYQNNQLWRVDLDLTKKNILVNEDKPVNYADQYQLEVNVDLVTQLQDTYNVYPTRLIQYDAYIFTFIDAKNKLYRYEVATDELLPIYEGQVYDYQYEGSWIYVSDLTTRQLYRLNQDGTDTQLIYEYPINQFQMSQGNLFFTDERDNNSLIMVNGNQERRRLLSGPILAFEVQGTQIYYRDEYDKGRLVRFDLQTLENQYLSVDKVFNLYREGDIIYYLSGNQAKFIFKIDTMSKSQQLINVAGPYASYIYVAGATIFIQEDFEDSSSRQSVPKDQIINLIEASIDSVTTADGHYIIVDKGLFFVDLQGGNIKSVDSNRVLDIERSETAIYYSGFNPNNYSMFIKKFDLETGRSSYVTLEKETEYDNTYQLYYTEGYLYFSRLDGGILCRISEDLMTKDILVEDVKTPIAFKNNQFIYENDNNQLVKLDLIDNQIKVLSESMWGYLGKNTSYFYFLENVDGNDKQPILYQVDFKGKMTKLKNSETINWSNFVYQNNSIYYFDALGLYRYDLVKQVKSTLTEELIISFYVGEQNIYYQVEDANGELETKNVLYE